MRLSLKSWCLAAAILLVVLMGAGLTVAVRTVNRVVELEQVSDDLDSRNLQFTAKFRSQLYRLHSLTLRHQMTGNEVVLRQIEREQEDTRDFLKERGTLFHQSDEREAFDDLQKKFEGYATEVATLVEMRKDTTGGELSTDEQIENLTILQEARDAVSEVADELGDRSRSRFRFALEDYRRAVERLKNFVFISLLLLIIALAGLSLLAWRAFVRPIQGELFEARKSIKTRNNLVTLGTLAAGLAHELRNPLTAIKARLYALSEQVGTDEKGSRQVEIIGSEIGRLERLVQEFLDFARPKEPEPIATAMVPYLQDIFDGLPGYDRVKVSLGELEEAEVKLDRDQMRQVLLNLLRNGVEACQGRAEGGEVILSARQQGGRYCIEIQDNGSGIPKESQSRLFEPFFSRKKGGSGLGLPICQNIVSAHGGNLEFVTSEGEGTTFRIELK